MKWLTDGSQNILKGSFTPDDVHHKHGISFITPVFPNSSATSEVKALMYLSNKSGDVSNEVTFYFCPDVEDKSPVLQATRQVAPTKRNSTALKETAQKSDQDQDQVVEEKSSGSIAVPPQRVKQSEVSNNAPTGSVIHMIYKILAWKSICRTKFDWFDATSGSYSYWTINNRFNVASYYRRRTTSVGSYMASSPDKKE